MNSACQPSRAADMHRCCVSMSPSALRPGVPLRWATTAFSYGHSLLRMQALLVVVVYLRPER